jgi:hypothetical protein
MPPLMLLQRPVMSTGRKIGLMALRLYLAAAMILVIVKIARLALGHEPPASKPSARAAGLPESRR